MKKNNKLSVQKESIRNLQCSEARWVEGGQAEPNAQAAEIRDFSVREKFGCCVMISINLCVPESFVCVSVSPDC